MAITSVDLDPKLIERTKELTRTCAGAVDILIAGYAIANDATVLTADHDFDCIAWISDLQHEFVAPLS